LDESEKPREPFFKQTNLHLDQEVVFLASRKLWQMTGNKRMLSSFVNRVLEEFVTEGDGSPDISIHQQARALAEKIRREKLSQRQLINDAETQRIDREKQEVERKKLIEKQTRLAIRKLGFKREFLRDRDHMSYESKRNALTDEVSLACRLDLQWKDLYSIAAEAVFEEIGA